MKNISLIKVIRTMVYSLILGLHLFLNPVLAHSGIGISKFKLQTHQVSGTVSDTNGALPGVTITIKRTNTAVITDFDGKYLINASATDTLVFSFMGYKTNYVAIKGRKIINVLLQEDATALQEVKINAGYYSVKESERTGSIARITAKDIETQPVNNPLAAIQGQMSGVNITQATGTPGSSFSIQIRGTNSIRAEGNDPLYIVDGVPYPSQSLGVADFTNSIMPGLVTPLNSINPADIESIEVLKDADATAIYGARAANGVVLITTKKGKAGTTRFSFQAYTTTGEVTRKVNLLNTEQYLSMRQEAFANDGIQTYPATAYDINGTWNRSRYTNWQKKLIGGTAFINNMQASVSGGSANTQFLVSTTYRHETTVSPGDAHYKKGVIHSTFSHRSENERFKISLSTDYTTDNNKLPGIDLTRYAYTLPPNAPALNDNEGNLNWENGTFDNPLGFLKAMYSNRSQNLISNALLSYKLFSQLEFKTSLGYNSTNFSEIRTKPSTMYNPFDGYDSTDSHSFNNKGSRNSWIIEPQLDWKKKFNRININILAGTTFQNQQQQTLALRGIGFASNDLINSIAAATTIIVLNDAITDYRYNAVFGRINGIWDEKYILNLTGRHDGSSRFGPGKRFANFGAIGLAWIFSKETLIKKIENTLSFGKLRVSYGITGNDQIGDYQFLDTYTTTANLYDGIAGIQPSRLFNANFGWETNKKLEVAFELGFFKDKIFLTAAWFKNSSSNQLVGVPLPGMTGFPTYQANLDATVENTGFELDFRSTNFQSKNFNWTTSLNLSIPKNRLLSYPDLEASPYANTFVIGQSLNIRKLYHYTGIDPNTGNYTFKDYNGDGLITNTEDRKAFLDSSPEFFGGLSNQLSYKNCSLDFSFQFVKQKGNTILSAFPITGSMANQAIEVLNHWPQDGTTATVQQYTSGANAPATAAFYNYISSDAIITDASFIRLKNISLAYTIPSVGLQGSTIRIYLQGQNLLTFTKYKGPDPENRSFSYLPPLRQLTLGLQLTF
ncbi:SusC/RagA family TonB-linked outer membrane protein [Flavobacterium sp. W1B]|uniref:SusC/RagA family TonB-linked outer membrane protein n=1 Tax=Flavobacterium sp. W1B TaxID=3394146 RepID=UPI0039BCB0DC